MSLSDGDTAEDGDIWFRIVTDKNHIKRGRVHHSAFGVNAIAKPNPDNDRPWDREVSGRLRSLSGSVDNIVEFARAYCEELTKGGGGTKTFSGLIFIKVSNANSNFEDQMTTGVYYTPIPEGDIAHADFTFTGWCIESREDKQRFNMWITELFQAIHHPGQLQLLPEAEGG